MSRTSFTGPSTGAYNTISDRSATGVSDSLVLRLAHTFETAARLHKIEIRTLGAGTGTITAFRVRRAAAGNTLVTSSGTQCLSADGGAVAAQATTAVDAESTPSLDSTQRDFAEGEQVGVFITTDGGTANAVIVTLVYAPVGHVAASWAND